MTKLILSAVLCVAISSANAQQSILSKSPDSFDPGSNAKTTASTFALPDNGSTSGNSRAPQGTQRYIRTCYIITAAELAASGFVNGVTLNAIGFNYQTAQNLPTTGTLKVYLENTTDLGYSKPTTTWTNATNGIIDNMTLVSNSSVTIPAAVGPWDIPFANGAAFTYTGGALYVAFEYENAAGTLATLANVAWCSNLLVNGTNGLRNAFSTAAMPAAATGSSNFRPGTRLGFPLANDVNIIDVYTLGKLPLTFGTPHIITARVANSGDNPWTNVNVTLNVTGANTFTDVQTLSLTPGNSTIVSFAAFTPASLGANTITVSVPNDDNNSNNSKTYAQTVNTGTMAFANTGAMPGSIGFNTGSGLLACRYTVNGTAYINAVNAFISNTATNVGNTMYGVVLNSAGAIIAQSNNFVIANADLGTIKSFPIVVPPSVTNADVYIAIAQTANAVTGYFPIGTQVEATPTRANAYFSFGLAGGVATNYNNLGRFAIEAEISTTPLSMDILELAATPKNGNIELTWKATNDAKHSFDIERSANGKDFNSISTTTATDNSQSIFRYTDVDAKGHNTLYYRIRQVDKAGRICYSPLATVNLDGSVQFELTVVNPIRDHVKLNIYTAKENNINIRITDMQGRVVYNGKRLCTIGTNIFTLDNTAQLQSGTYQVSINNGSETISRTIIQQ